VRDLGGDIDAAEARATEAEHQRQLALVRVEKIERRADELRLELDRAHAEADYWRLLVQKLDEQPKQP